MQKKTTGRMGTPGLWILVGQRVRATVSEVDTSPWFRSYLSSFPLFEEHPLELVMARWGGVLLQCGVAARRLYVVDNLVNILLGGGKRTTVMFSLLAGRNFRCFFLLLRDFQTALWWGRYYVVRGLVCLAVVGKED